ncbi:hypothetical protein [Sphingobacterium sp. LRF_L2]|uniref:hypothetical protein n=1 Tax=Sphingobacterium sp. LRF_L2 TaxID=3369421 RepID=UPI003F6223E8
MRYPVTKNTIFLSVLLAAATSCASKKAQDSLIRDCPDEKIINKMPTVQQPGVDKQSNSYFIYKGERRELSEFDINWLEKNCKVKESIVY